MEALIIIICSKFGCMLSLEVAKVASLRFLWSIRWLHLYEIKGVFGKCIEPTICVNLGDDF